MFPLKTGECPVINPHIPVFVTFHNGESAQDVAGLIDWSKVSEWRVNELPEGFRPCWEASGEFGLSDSRMLVRFWAIDSSGSVVVHQPEQRTLTANVRLHASAPKLAVIGYAVTDRDIGSYTGFTERVASWLKATGGRLASFAGGEYLCNAFGDVAAMTVGNQPWDRRAHPSKKPVIQEAENTAINPDRPRLLTGGEPILAASEAAKDRPAQIGDDVINNGGAAPAANVNIVNAIDSGGVISECLSTAEGENAIINLIKTGAHSQDPDYVSLHDVLMRAYDQAASGKGKERHAQDRPFDAQPMQQISDLVGSQDGMAYQAIKKIQESLRLPAGADIRELLGAINYIAGMVIWLERKRENDR